MTTTRSSLVAATTFVMAALHHPIQAQVITPVSVQATSEFGEVDVFGDGNLSAVFVTSLIDGSGLVGPDGLPCDLPTDECLHDFDGSATTMWHAGGFDAGLPGGVGPTLSDPPLVEDQQVEFDLGASYEVTTAYVWQMNQGGAFGALAPERGVDEMTILASPDANGDTFTTVGTFFLEVEAGDSLISAQELDLSAIEGTVRRIRFDIQSAHNPEAPKVAEFVGLSEVRFGGPLVVLEGDLNGDGSVDASDAGEMFAVWGVAGGNGPADLNADGFVDASDAQTLFANWTGDAAIQSVPEPTCATLALLGLVTTVAVRRRTRVD